MTNKSSLISKPLIEINSVLNNRNIADDLIDTALNVFAYKAEDFYEYGRDHYYLGLPEGSLGQYVPKFGEVNKILNQLNPLPTGQAWMVSVAEVKPIDMYFVGEYVLANYPGNDYEYYYVDEDGERY